MRVLTAKELFEKYANKLDDRDDELWGPHIVREAVTYLVGETCVGKSVLLGNLCYKLSKGEPFLNIAPPRPLRVLHLDYESYGRAMVVNLFSIGFDSENWHIPDMAEEIRANGSAPNGPRLLQWLDQHVAPGQYDLVIVDPLMDAYPVSNENDNAEASAQMNHFKHLARAKGVGVVVVHNTGRGAFDPHNPQESSAQGRADRKHLGRGAAARQDRADIGINYVRVNDTTRLMKIVKARVNENLGLQWQLSFDGDHGFVVDNVSHGVVSHAPPLSDETLRQVVGVIQAHPDLSVNELYETYISGQVNVSRATFFRRARAVRNQPAAGATSPQSLEAAGTPAVS